ncbi:TVP38/TMEM64 family protein [Nocardia sp. NPDC006044]|uniref:TVP38/TMEM64 family protein n=1 Tax=Nocardia sp. NPDC006044 TaxID=3364306 RepID=UPI00367DC5E1
MTDEGSPQTNRWRHGARLAACIVFLLTMFYLVAVVHVIDINRVRDLVEATGPAAPLVYALVAALLGAILVPGPILAAGSGLLFGPLVGTFVTLAATVGTATISSYLGRRAGHQSARGLLGPERADRLTAQLDRHGLWAVVGQRFIPGAPDALSAYTFGALGIPLWQMATGALIGSTPRAFVYTALGASIGDLSAPLAYTAITIWCITAILGALAAHRTLQTWRHRKTPDPEPPAKP